MLFAADPLNILIAYPTTRRGVVSFVDSPNRCHVRRRQRLKLRKGDETDAPLLPLLPPVGFSLRRPLLHPRYARCAEHHYSTYQPSRSLPQKKVRGADAYLSIRR